MKKKNQKQYCNAEKDKVNISIK